MAGRLIEEMAANIVQIGDHLLGRERSATHRSRADVCLYCRGSQQQFQRLRSEAQTRQLQPMRGAWLLPGWHPTDADYEKHKSGDCTVLRRALWLGASFRASDPWTKEWKILVHSLRYQVVHECSEPVLPTRQLLVLDLDDDEATQTWSAAVLRQHVAAAQLSVFFLRRSTWDRLASAFSQEGGDFPAQLVVLAAPDRAALRELHAFLLLSLMRCRVQEAVQFARERPAWRVQVGSDPALPCQCLVY